MQRHPFTMYTMFRSKPKNLEKRITAYYQESNDRDTVIKLVRLIQIRDVLGKEEIERPCYELVRTLYLETMTETMKRYFFYFREYFSHSEWVSLLLLYFPEIPQFRLQQIVQSLYRIWGMVNYCYTVP